MHNIFLLKETWMKQLHISQVKSTELTEPNSVSTAAWTVIIRPMRHLCLVYLSVAP